MLRELPRTDPELKQSKRVKREMGGDSAGQCDHFLANDVADAANASSL